MGRRCTICGHPERAAIERAVANGEPYRAIAQRFAVSGDALGRHVKNGHIASVVLATAEPEVLESTDILQEMTRLRERAREIERVATKNRNYRMALSAIREQSRIIENLVKLAALLRDRAAEDELSQGGWSQEVAVIEGWCTEP